MTSFTTYHVVKKKREVGEALDGDLLLVGFAPEDNDPDFAVDRNFLDDRGHVEVGAPSHDNIVNLWKK